VNIEDSLFKTILRAKVFINGLMADSMRALGKLIKWKVKDYLHG